MGNAEYMGEYMGKLNLKLEKIIKMKLAATLVVVASAGKVKDPVKRLNKLRGHAETLVFDQENFCKLNGQVATALRSFVRKYGCEGSFPKKNFPNTFAKRTRRMRNIFARIADC